MPSPNHLAAPSRMHCAVLTFDVSICSRCHGMLVWCAVYARLPVYGITHPDMQGPAAGDCGTQALRQLVAPAGTVT